MPPKDLSGFFLILLWIPPQDQIHKPWHLQWRCGKKAGWDVEEHQWQWKAAYVTKAAKLKEKDEKGVSDWQSKGKFEGAKGSAKVARKKVEEAEEEEEEEEEGEEEKKKKLCLLVNTLE